MIDYVGCDGKVRALLGRLNMARKLSDFPESGPYRLAVSTSHLLHRAEQLAADRFAQLVGDNVTLRQFAVLAAIAEAPGLSQVELVRATGIDRSTLADMINRMESRGLVERTPSQVDGRAHAVHLAPAGASVFKTSIAHARAADARILDMLPRTKAKSLQSVLAKLAELADKEAAKEDRMARRQAKRDARKKQREKAREKARVKRDEEKPAGKKGGGRRRA
jgi:DNA-binding MarR family transcriptional regulator